MEAIKLKPSLEKFLKERGVYEQFLFNVQNDTHKTLGITKIEDINGYIGSICFFVAFEWDNTPEGFDFWETLAGQYDETEIINK